MSNVQHVLCLNLSTDLSLYIHDKFPLELVKMYSILEVLTGRYIGTAGLHVVNNLRAFSHRHKRQRVSRLARPDIKDYKIKVDRRERFGFGR